ncbi:MAG: ATP-binding protein [Bacteroidetes bacterium]|nr:ATP-binding protein [Bacteroidota bacterium]
MNSPIKKIGLILVVIFLLPSIFYSAYELSSLNKNEAIIEEIYNNQLDAILYSVNQYSDDVSSGWASYINLILSQPGDIGESPAELYQKLEPFINENIPVLFLFFVDSINGNQIAVISKDHDETRAALSAQIKEKFQKEQKLIKRLFTYQRGGFRKIEAFPDVFQDNRNALHFLLDTPYKGYRICGIVIDPVTFISEVLGPKMQNISQEKFIITAYDKNSDQPVYTTELTGNTSAIQDVDTPKRPFWILPDHYLSISFKGKTIAGMVRDRSITNLFLILALNIFLLTGVWFVFRNIRRELQLAQNKSDFVSNVSHEIRTPLALISMFAETLQMGRVKTEEKKQEYYAIISKESNRLATIVNSILNFSKMEANKKIYNFEETNLNEVVEDILKTYDFHLKNHGFQYEFIPDQSIQKIQTDQESIKEAVINLLDNAIKYSKETKKIEVKTGQYNGYEFIEVKDHGIGISKVDQKEIFEKFFRVSSGLVHNTKGTGLGLSLVKHIMKGHKGKITLTSVLDKGSSFKLHFPVNHGTHQ